MTGKKSAYLLLASIIVVVALVASWLRWIDARLDQSEAPGVWAAAYIVGETEFEFTRKNKLASPSKEEVLFEPPCEKPTLLGMCDSTMTPIYAEHGWRYLAPTAPYIAAKRVKCIVAPKSEECR